MRRNKARRLEFTKREQVVNERNRRRSWRTNFLSMLLAVIAFGLLFVAIGVVFT